MRAALLLALSLLAVTAPATALPHQAEPALRSYGGCEVHGAYTCAFTVSIPPGVGEVCANGACTPGAFPWATNANTNVGALTIIEILVWSSVRAYEFVCIVELEATTCGSDALPQNPLGGLPAMSIGVGEYEGHAAVRYSDTTDWTVAIQGFADPL